MGGHPWEGHAWLGGLHKAGRVESLSELLAVGGELGSERAGLGVRPKW